MKLLFWILFVSFVVLINNHVKSQVRKKSKKTTTVAAIKAFNKGAIGLSQKHTVYISGIGKQSVRANFIEQDKAQYAIEFQAAKTIRNAQNFINSDSFQIPIYQLYNDMQKNLGIDQEAVQLPTREILATGIRVYPAVKDTTVAGTDKRILYLVLLGETSHFNPATGKREYNTMLNTYYYKCTNNSFSQVALKDTPTVNQDIKDFQKLWITLYPNSAKLPQSYSFTIKELNDLLGNDHLQISDNMMTNNGKGLSFSACFNTKKNIFFVAKGYAPDQRSRNPTAIIEAKNFYDNMDPCPDKCPINEIKYP